MVKTGILSSEGLICVILWGLFSLVTLVSLWMPGDILLLGLNHLSLDFVCGKNTLLASINGITDLVRGVDD